LIFSYRLSPASGSSFFGGFVAEEMKIGDTVYPKVGLYAGEPVIFDGIEEGVENYGKVRVVLPPASHYSFQKQDGEEPIIEERRFDWYSPKELRKTEPKKDEADSG
jgi:hypothetical protein